jgi:hypothetical protein
MLKNKCNIILEFNKTPSELKSKKRKLDDNESNLKNTNNNKLQKTAIIIIDLT